MTPPVGYADDGLGMAIVLLIVAAIATYHLYDLGHRIKLSRPKPPKRRRFLSWDDRLNIHQWQARRNTR